MGRAVVSGPDGGLVQHQPPSARQGIIQEQRDPSQLAVTANHHLGRIALHGVTINGREPSCIGSRLRGADGRRPQRS